MCGGIRDSTLSAPQRLSCCCIVRATVLSLVQHDGRLHEPAVGVMRLVMGSRDGSRLGRPMYCISAHSVFRIGSLLIRLSVTRVLAPCRCVGVVFLSVHSREGDLMKDTLPTRLSTGTIIAALKESERGVLEPALLPLRLVPRKMQVSEGGA